MLRCSDPPCMARCMLMQAVKVVLSLPCTHVLSCCTCTLQAVLSRVQPCACCKCSRRPASTASCSAPNWCLFWSAALCCHRGLSSTSSRLSWGRARDAGCAPGAVSAHAGVPLASGLLPAQPVVAVKQRYAARTACCGWACLLMHLHTHSPAGPCPPPRQLVVLHPTSTGPCKTGSVLQWPSRPLQDAQQTACRNDVQSCGELQARAPLPPVAAPVSTTAMAVAAARWCTPRGAVTATRPAAVGRAHGRVCVAAAARQQALQVLPVLLGPMVLPQAAAATAAALARAWMRVAGCCLQSRAAQKQQRRQL